MILRDLLESIIPTDHSGFTAFKNQLRCLRGVSHTFTRDIAQSLNRTTRTLQEVMQPLTKSLQDLDQAADAILRKCDTLPDDDVGALRGLIRRAEFITNIAKDLSPISIHILKCMQVILEQRRRMEEVLLKRREVCSVVHSSPVLLGCRYVYRSSIHPRGAAANNGAGFRNEEETHAGNERICLSIAISTS